MRTVSGSGMAAMSSNEGGVLMVAGEGVEEIQAEVQVERGVVV